MKFLLQLFRLLLTLITITQARQTIRSQDQKLIRKELSRINFHTKKTKSFRPLENFGPKNFVQNTKNETIIVSKAKNSNYDQFYYNSLCHNHLRFDVQIIFDANQSLLDQIDSIYKRLVYPRRGYYSRKYYNSNNSNNNFIKFKNTRVSLWYTYDGQIICRKLGSGYTKTFYMIQNLQLEKISQPTENLCKNATSNGAQCCMTLIDSLNYMNSISNPNNLWVTATSFQDFSSGKIEEIDRTRSLVVFDYDKDENYSLDQQLCGLFSECKQSVRKQSFFNQPFDPIKFRYNGNNNKRNYPVEYDCPIHPCSNSNSHNSALASAFCSDVNSVCKNTGLYGKACRKVTKADDQLKKDLDFYQISQYFDQKYSKKKKKGVKNNKVNDNKVNDNKVNDNNNDFFCFINPTREFLPNSDIDFYPGDQEDFVPIELGYPKKATVFQYLNEYFQNTTTSSFADPMLDFLQNQSQNQSATQSTTQLINRIQYPIFKFHSTGNFWDKSRLELTSCFVHKKFLDRLLKTEEVKSHYDSSQKKNLTETDLYYLVKIRSISKFCPAALLPLDSRHQYSYKMMFDLHDEKNSKFGNNATYILAQWHGHAESTLFRDQGRKNFGSLSKEKSRGGPCVAKLSLEDTAAICSPTCLRSGTKNYDTRQSINAKSSIEFLEQNINERCNKTFTKTLRHFQISKTKSKRKFLPCASKKVGCNGGEVVIRENSDDESLGSGTDGSDIIGTGLNYEQGGYPALTFAIKDGYYVIWVWGCN